jgi:cbb3-type cytochrome oxidase subunit 3
MRIIVTELNRERKKWREEEEKLVLNLKDEAQTASFKDPVRTAL